MEKRYRLFLWGWCGTCDCAFVFCPECWNNSCNAGFGKKGKCTTCNLAYQYSHHSFNNGDYPKTKKEIAKFNREIIKKEGHKEQDYKDPRPKPTKEEKKLLRKIFGKKSC